MELWELKERMHYKWRATLREYMRDGYVATEGKATAHSISAVLVKGERRLELEIEIACAIPYIEVRRGGKVKSITYF